MIKVKRALISVSAKKGIVPFAKALHQQGVEIISTGGTARQLADAGIPVREIADYTGFPEMMNGRVKTLHPKVHAALLALRDNPEHMNQAQAHDVDLIDMVVVNLYPFEQVTSKKNVHFEDAIENIDIGGPAMLRSAAKNFRSVAVVCNPERYESVLQELKANSGIVSDAMLYRLALEAFEHTAQYDTLIHRYLKKRLETEEFNTWPRDLAMQWSKVQDLRYGENPHQTAAFYQDVGNPIGLAAMKQLHGKELSFNNLLDLNAALDFIRDFQRPAAVIIKHNNPTGLAVDDDLTKAYQAAHRCDPISAFGGIIAFNRPVDAKTADAISASGFMECVLAPSFDTDALQMLQQKKNVRLLTLAIEDLPAGGLDLKRVSGGVLVQDRDIKECDPDLFQVVTKKKPTAAQQDAIAFGWQAVKNVRSNAIILVKGTATVGIGCAQTSRVESVRIAIAKAGNRAKNAVLISDAFLPKTDNVELAAAAGIKTIVQTGGSIADADVIAAADKAGVAMVMTGVRHFKH